jgi:hypothetical protein
MPIDLGAFLSSFSGTLYRPKCFIHRHSAHFPFPPFVYIGRIESSFADNLILGIYAYIAFVTKMFFTILFCALSLSIYLHTWFVFLILLSWCHSQKNIASGYYVGIHDSSFFNQLFQLDFTYYTAEYSVHQIVL